MSGTVLGSKESVMTICFGRHKGYLRHIKIITHEGYYLLTLPTPQCMNLPLRPLHLGASRDFLQPLSPLLARISPRPAPPPPSV